MATGTMSKRTEHHANSEQEKAARLATFPVVMDRAHILSFYRTKLILQISLINFSITIANITNTKTSVLNLMLYAYEWD